MDDFTDRQRKLLGQDHARDVFKRTFDVVYFLECFHRKVKAPEDEWLRRAAALECALQCTKASGAQPASALVTVEALGQKAAEGPATLQVDLLQLLHALPQHLMACLLFYDPPGPTESDVTPQELTPFTINCPTFLQHMLRCTDMILCISCMLCTAVENKHNLSLGSVDWLPLQADALRLTIGESRASGLITEVLDAVNMALAKMLGPLRPQFEEGILMSPEEDEDKLFLACTRRMKMVTHLVNALDYLCVMQAAVRHGVAVQALAHAAIDQVNENLLFCQAAAPHFLQRFAAYLGIVFRLLRERILTRVADPEASSRTIRDTRAVALLLGTAHQVLERWLQSSVWRSIFEAHEPVSHAIVVAFLELALSGMSLCSSDPDADGRRISSRAYAYGGPEPMPKELANDYLPENMRQLVRDSQDPKHVRTITVNVNTSVLSGDVELLVARSHQLFAIITAHLATRVKVLGMQQASEGSSASGSSAWWLADEPWVLPWMACVFHTLLMAPQVLSRKWPSESGVVPPKQTNEGQLAINVLRSAVALCRSNCPAFYCQPLWCPYSLALRQFEILALVMRRILRTSPAKDAATLELWSAGPAALALFSRESVVIAPLSTFSSKPLQNLACHMLCIDGVDVRSLLMADWVAWQSPDPDGQARKVPRANKARGRSDSGPSIEQVQQMLQAREINLLVWRLLYHSVELHIVSMGANDAGNNGKSKAVRFSETPLAKKLRQAAEHQLARMKASSIEEKREYCRHFQNNIANVLKQHIQGPARTTEACIRCNGNRDDADELFDEFDRMFDKLFDNICADVRPAPTQVR